MLSKYDSQRLFCGYGTRCVVMHRDVFRFRNRVARAAVSMQAPLYVTTDTRNRSSRLPRKLHIDIYSHKRTPKVNTSSGTVDACSGNATACLVQAQATVSGTCLTGWLVPR